MAIAGHFWTVFPHVAGRVRPARLRDFEPWRTQIDDRDLGTLELRGLSRPTPAKDAVLIVHGLGGGLDSPYMRRAAIAVSRAGMGCLMLAVRGASRMGQDLYHAGQTADLEAALRSPALAGYERVFVLGFSLGGHMALRLGLDPPENVRAVAAVCPPLDLEKSARALDAPRTWPYRRHVLGGLREIYREVARRREVPTPVSRVNSVSTIREWDRLTIVPRYGFTDVAEYYESMSVGPRLSELKVPALIIHSEADPMVPSWTVEDAFAEAGSDTVIRRIDSGGHVGFSRRLDLGYAGERGLENQILRWFSGRTG